MSDMQTRETMLLGLQGSRPTMAEELLLKWGTLKGWNNASDATLERLKRYHEQPVAPGVMHQHDTPEQVDILCEIIDGIDGEIINDWSGEKMSKDEAKRYVREYRRQ